MRPRDLTVSSVIQRDFNSMDTEIRNPPQVLLLLNVKYGCAIVVCYSDTENRYRRYHQPGMSAQTLPCSEITAYCLLILPL